MKNKKLYNKLSRTGEHRIALMKNLSKQLFKHKTIMTTKPKTVSLLSYLGRFITRMLKHKNDINLHRYIRSKITNNDKKVFQAIYAFYLEKIERKRLCNYIKKRRMYKQHGDGAIIMKLSLI